MIVAYDMERLPSDFIQYVKDLHAHANHEPHSYKLARALKIGVRVALHNYAVVESEPHPLIFLHPWWFGGNNDVTRHELAHVMLWWSGLEERILLEYGPELGKRVVERLCNQAIAFLRIPQPLVDQAVAKFGLSAHAIQHLVRVTGAPYQMVMDRMVYDCPAEARAAFMTHRSYVTNVSVNNLRIPFWLSDRVPELAQLVPDASLVQLPKGIGLLGFLHGGSKDAWYWEGA